MTRIYAVQCVERLHVNAVDGDGTEGKGRDVTRSVSRIVSVTGYAEDAIKKAKKLINETEVAKDGSTEVKRVGVDVVTVVLQNEAE
jgi:hypothetical protein